MWLKSAILFAVLSGGIAAADAAPVYHCDSGSSRVYTSEPQPDCREQAALPKISAYTASQTKAAPRKAAASKKQARQSPAKKSQSKPTRQAAKPKRQNKTVIHFVYFIASIIPFLSYIFCISFCNPNFSPRIICIHHREIHQFHFHRVQRIFSSKAWKQRNRKLISTYR